MKLGRVTKLDKTNTTTLKKLEDDAMLANCDVIVIFPIYGQVGAIWKPDSDAWSVKFTFSLIAIFYLTENVNSTKVSLTQLTYYCFE